jgi:hypothetical protein
MTDFDVKEDSTISVSFLAYTRPRRPTDLTLQYLIPSPRYRTLRRQGYLGIWTVLIALVLLPNWLTRTCGAGDDLRLMICRRCE